MNKLVLATNKKEGLFKQVPCYLVFGDDGIVLAFISKERMKLIVAEYKQQMKEEGKGAIKRALGLITFWKTYTEHFQSLTKEEILSEDSSNWEIPYSHASKVKFRGETQKMDSNETMSTVIGTLTIQTTEKLKFTHNYTDNNRNIKPILVEIFGSNLKYRADKALVIGGKGKIT